MKSYNLVELFSGIGSQAKALKNLGCKVNTLGTCEWDIHAFCAYDSIHESTEIPEEIKNMSKEEILSILSEMKLSNNGKEEMEYKVLKTYRPDALRKIYAAIVRDHNFVDISSLKGEEMPENIDILTYSFPCQDLSNVGAFHGYNKGIDKDSGSRSSLLWQVGRILTEMKAVGKELPHFLLLENVPSLLSPRHFSNFEMWMDDLKNLGYISKYFLLNASSFGLPQNRPRLLMISVYAGKNPKKAEIIKKYFDKKTSDSIVEDYISSKHYKKLEITDLLRTDYSDQKLWEEALECNPNDTPSRRAIWDENPKIILPGNKLTEETDVVRTITTKQDRNPNSGNLYFESGIEGRSKFRYLTPRECFLFMGFTDEDYDNVIKNNPEVRKGHIMLPRDKLIRMAGNSIPVKLLEGIFLQILKIDKKLSKK